jgi:hypothetical protein
MNYCSGSGLSLLGKTFHQNQETRGLKRAVCQTVQMEQKVMSYERKIVKKTFLLLMKV